MKKRKKIKRSIKAGVSPGTLVHVGNIFNKDVQLDLIDFNENELLEVCVLQLEDHQQAFSKDTVSWLNMIGIHDANAIKALGEYFSIDELVLEDIMNSNKRPKVEDFDDYLFLTVQMMSMTETEGLQNEQVSFVLFKDKIISFQESEGDVFDPIRARIRTSKGKVRFKKVDYLGILLLDIIVDNYFFSLETLGEKIDALEERVMKDTSDKFMEELQDIKTQLTTMRRAVFPMRELLSFLMRKENKLISPENNKYVRDTYDHCVEVLDELDTLVEQINSIRDQHMSVVSNRMNQIMKVLTIMTALFIPLTFIAGIYGMNFKNMPEIENSEYGYVSVLSVMAVITVALIVYFRRKGWF